MLSKEVITQWEICKEKILSGQKRKLSVEEMDFFDQLSSELFNLNFSYRTSSIKKEDFVWFMSIIKENFPKLEKNNHQLLEKFNTLFLSDDEHNDTAHNYLSITYMGYSDMLRTYERLLKLWGDFDAEEVKSLKIERSRLRDLIREQESETLKSTRLVKSSSGFLQLQFLTGSFDRGLSEQEKEKLRDLELKDIQEEYNFIYFHLPYPLLTILPLPF